MALFKKTKINTIIILYNIARCKVQEYKKNTRPQKYKKAKIRSEDKTSEKLKIQKLKWKKKQKTKNKKQDKCTTPLDVYSYFERGCRKKCARVNPQR